MVDSWGTGRPDYSENVEYSTEPIIRGAQNKYVYYLEILDVAAGGEATIDIDITADTVVMLYDFYMSSIANVLLDFNLFTIDSDGAVTATIFRDRDYQRVYHKIPQGFPFFDTYRVGYKNNSNRTIDLFLNIAGLYTSEKEYYLTVGQPKE